MSRRTELHEILKNVLGSSNVYFQPPSTIKMKYPCIIYNRNNISVRHGDNMVYKHLQGYMLIVVDPNPDSLILEKVTMLPLCRFDRHYTADNLNHDVYTIFY